MSRHKQGKAADRLIRCSAFLVVAAVAGVAGWVSYGHAVDVIRLAGERGAVLFAYPVFVDGLVYMSSMVLLDSARHGKRGKDAPALAWWSLAVGIVLTLAANVYSEASHGVLGGLVGALPAVALVLSYELGMMLVRGNAVHGSDAVYRESGTPLTRDSAPDAVRQRLNGHAERALELWSDELSAGTVPGTRRIKAGLGVGSEKAAEIRDLLRDAVT